jgi:hypothetical protein
LAVSFTGPFTFALQFAVVNLSTFQFSVAFTVAGTVPFDLLGELAFALPFTVTFALTFGLPSPTSFFFVARTVAVAITAAEIERAGQHRCSRNKFLLHVEPRLGLGDIVIVVPFGEFCASGDSETSSDGCREWRMAVRACSLRSTSALTKPIHHSCGYGPHRSARIGTVTADSEEE